MSPRVVGTDEGAVKKITHKNCAAVIEYTPSDVRLLWSGKDYSGGSAGAKGFTCPHCGENVITERW